MTSCSMGTKVDQEAGTAADGETPNGEVGVENRSLPNGQCLGEQALHDGFFMVGPEALRTGMRPRFSCNIATAQEQVPVHNEDIKHEKGRTAGLSPAIRPVEEIAQGGHASIPDHQKHDNSIALADAHTQLPLSTCVADSEPDSVDLSAFPVPCALVSPPGGAEIDDHPSSIVPLSDLQDKVLQVIDLSNLKHSDLIAAAKQAHQGQDDPFQSVMKGIMDSIDVETPSHKEAYSFSMGGVPDDSEYARAWRSILRGNKAVAFHDQHYQSPYHLQVS